MCTNLRSIRFHINSKTIGGSFVLTFDSFITSRIEDEIESFICLQSKKKKNDIFIQKVNNVYEINVKGFIAVCNKIFSVLQRCS